MKTARFFSAALALVLVAGVASAQVPWCMDGPNAALTLQGLNPDTADPVNHDVTVTLPGFFDLQITTGANANAGLALLGSPLQAAAQVGFPQGLIPWDVNDSIDIGTFSTPLPGNIQVIGDGLNPAPGVVNDLFFASDDGNIAFGTPPTFTLLYNVGTPLDGQQLAFQAIVRDVTNPPFNFDTTSAVSAEFIIGLTAVAPVGDDGSSEVAFTPGFTFDFHGVQYPSIWVNGNGYANFGAQTTVAAAGFTTDFVSLAGAEPFIAIHNADWNPGVIGYQQVGSSSTAIWGDPANGGNMAHFASSDNGNIYSLNFELNDGVNPLAGNFQISHDFLVDDETLTPTDYGDGARGHGPGGAATTTPVAEADLNQLGTTIPGEAQLEEHDRSAGTIANGWDGAGSLRGYNNADKNWNGGTVDFFPNPAVAIAGDSGYTSIPDIAGPMAQAEDIGAVVDLATGAPVGSISDAGGELITISGSFEQLIDAAGPGAATVVFDANGTVGGPFPGALVGIHDTSGSLVAAGVNAAFVLGGSGPGTPHRDMQACDVITPVFPMGTAGSIDVTLTFVSGNTFSTTVLVAAAGSNVQTFQLTDDGAQTVALSANSIPFYGTSFTSIEVGANGVVGFGTMAGTNGFSNNVMDAFNGFDEGATLAGCGLWLDLNPGGIGGPSNFVVTEDTMTGVTTVDYLGAQDWNSNNNLGDWSYTFDGLGLTTFDFTNMAQALDSIATLAYTDGDGLLPTVGSDTDLSDGLGGGFTAAQGVYSTGVTAGTVAPDSVAEDIPALVDLRTNFLGGGAVVNILDAGNNGTLVIF